MNSRKALENVIGEMAAILSQPGCVKQKNDYLLHMNLLSYATKETECSEHLTTVMLNLF